MKGFKKEQAWRNHEKKSEKEEKSTLPTEKNRSKKKLQIQVQRILRILHCPEIEIDHFIRLCDW